MRSRRITASSSVASFQQLSFSIRFLFFRNSPLSFLFSLFIILFHFLFCICCNLFEMQAVIWTISRVVICPSKMNTKCSPLSCRAMLDIEFVWPATCHKFFFAFHFKDLPRPSALMANLPSIRLAKSKFSSLLCRLTGSKKKAMKASNVGRKAFNILVSPTQMNCPQVW